MKKLSLLISSFLLPAFAFAEVATPLRSVFDILDFIKKFINLAIPIIIALAVLMFIWGVFRYVVASDEDAKERGKNLMIWGIVGLFVMVSVWGLVNILSDTLNLDTKAPNPPELPRY